MISDEQYQIRLNSAIEDEDWVSLYRDLFGSLPEGFGEDWGVFPIEKVADAVIDRKPIKIKKPSLRDSVVL